MSPLLLERARAMRAEQVPAEQKLWRRLRNRSLVRLKIRRQVPIGAYVVDFYCAEASVVVEIDGESHEDRERYDERRTDWLRSRGLTVIRFNNVEVHENLEGVLSAIARACRKDA